MSHIFTTWLYDNIYKFETLSPNKNLDIDNRSKDVTDFEAPQSLLFFFKQMDNKEKLKFEYP